MNTTGPILGLRDVFNSLNYPQVSEQLPLLRQDVIQRADLIAFGSEIPSQKSACIAGQTCESHVSSENYVKAIAQTGIRYACLAFPDGKTDLWCVDAGDGPGELDLKRVKRGRIDVIVRHLIDNSERYGPDSVLKQKFRACSYSQANDKPWQLSFASAGLLDLQEEQSEDSLVKLLSHCTDFGLKQWRQFSDCPEDADIRIGRTFLRLVAAKALVDKGICLSDSYELDSCLNSAREALPSFISPETVQLPRKILEALWIRLQEVRFELLTGDMLAGIYEKGLLTAAEQRRHGIHYTPHSLRRLLWNAVSEHLRNVDPSALRILDPTCGSGGFVLTAYDGLARMFGESVYRPHSVQLIRNCLFGVDQDPFACDIARLALILQSQPISNAWMIQQSDFFKWSPGVRSGPNVILGNPPFQLAAEVFLKSISLLTYGGLIGMVMPRSFLTSVKDEHVRHTIAKNTELIGVVEFPDKVFKHSQASTCAVIARRLPSKTTSARFFDYLALDRSIYPEEQRRRFFIGDWAFARNAAKLEARHFIDGSLELADLWENLEAETTVGELTELHKGIILRGKKCKAEYATSDTTDEEVKETRESEDFDVAEVVDGSKPGYLPFLANARDFIDPFFIKNAKYLEWQPQKMYRSGSLERWQPNKVLIGRCVTHKQRWRLRGAVDSVGFAYDSRLIGCILQNSEWSPYALLSFLSSSYANAWYSSHSQHGDITLLTLRKMPVPRLSEDKLEHLSALGVALGRCAEIRSTVYGDKPLVAMCEYATGEILNEVDKLILDAFKFDRVQKEQIAVFMNQAGERRPGLPSSREGSFHMDPRRQENSLPLYETTGIVLSCTKKTEQAILWLDGLELSAPLVVPADLLTGTSCHAGEPIKARATLTARRLSQFRVDNVVSYKNARLSRAELLARIEALISRPDCNGRNSGDGHDT